jgi:hypothetical protein
MNRRDDLLEYLNDTFTADNYEGYKLVEISDIIKSHCIELVNSLDDKYIVYLLSFDRNQHGTIEFYFDNDINTMDIEIGNTSFGVIIRDKSGNIYEMYEISELNEFVDTKCKELF